MLGRQSSSLLDGNGSGNFAGSTQQLQVDFELKARYCGTKVQASRQ
jgi:hypothetical protein